MKKALKKLVRSTQVLFPGLVDAKFAIHNWIFRTTGRVFKRELNGLRHFNLGGKLLVDIGANRGQSIVAFRNAVPNCQVLAFEPNRLLAHRLAERYANDRNARIEACALSNQPGSFTLHIPSYGGYQFDGLATGDPNVGQWFNRDRFYWFNPKKISVEKTTVPTRTLDSFDVAPALMKLHAQRAEILILQGAERTVAKHGPIILTAWTWDEETEYLRALGYQSHAYRHGNFHAGILGEEFTWFLLPKHVEEVCRNRSRFNR